MAQSIGTPDSVSAGDGLQNAASSGFASALGSVGALGNMGSLVSAAASGAASAAGRASGLVAAATGAAAATAAGGNSGGMVVGSSSSSSNPSPVTSSELLWKLDALQTFIRELHWPEESFAEHLDNRLKMMAADMIDAAAQQYVDDRFSVSLSLSLCASNPVTWCSSLVLLRQLLFSRDRRCVVCHRMRHILFPCDVAWYDHYIGSESNVLR